MHQQSLSPYIKKIKHLVYNESDYIIVPVNEEDIRYANQLYLAYVKYEIFNKVI